MSTFDDPFSIPLLKFPTDVHSPAPQSLPFKIAWPERMQANDEVELPLLQLSDKNEQDSECPSFPLPSVGHCAPLLHFSTQNNEDGNLNDFQFVQVPAHEDFHFPLLYLPETGIEVAKYESSYGGDTKKDKQPERKREQNEIFSEKNSVNELGETSTARYLESQT